MAQTLTRVTKGADLTVAATALSTQTNLITNMQAVANLSQQELLALAVIGLATYLANNGGVDYTAAYDNLREQAMTLTNGLPRVVDPMVRDQLQCVEAWNSGKYASAGLSGDVATLLTTAKVLRIRSEDELRRMLFLLRFQAGI